MGLKTDKAWDESKQYTLKRVECHSEKSHKLCDKMQK